jgi:putative phosphoesterase
MMRVGLISDTHGLLRPEALEALKACDVILHAGDIGDVAILDRLRQIAPVHAVRGNNDVEKWAALIPRQLDLVLEDVRVRLLHDVADFVAGPEACDVLVVGHSHKPRVETRCGVLEVNPGSAGPRRFSLPISVAQLVISAKEVKVDLIEIQAAAVKKTPRP